MSFTQQTQAPTRNMDQVPVKDTPVPDHQQTRETGIPQSYPQDKAPATAAEHGVSEVAQQRPDIAGDSEKDHNKGAPEGGYPEQLHAGKVGYGPHYAEMHGRVTMQDKIHGLQQEIKGKITRNPEEVEKGKKQMSGEAKRQHMDEDDKTSPFGGAKDDKSADAGKVTEEVKIANYPQGNHSQGQDSTSTQEHPASRIDTSHPTDQKPTMSQEHVGDQVRTAEHHQVNASIV